MTMPRREFLRLLTAGGIALSGVAGCATPGASKAPGKVVVIGGGFGGATVAKYLKLWGGGSVDVTLVESNPAFVSCPMSNLVLGGTWSLADLTVGYEGLTRLGIAVVHDVATAVDPDRRVVRLARGSELRYDRLVLSPGIDFLYGEVPGLNNQDAQSRVLHAWKAGPQTVALRRQIEAMPDGGVFAISIPRAPLRCPPGPYERACQVAWYFKRAKPRAKVLVLDGNEDVQSKKALFLRAWSEEYKGIVEYRPNYVLTDVDMNTLTMKFDFADEVKADVLNVIPPHRAGNIAAQAGVITANNAWCEVDFLTFESIKVPNIHILGDSIQVAPLMPKSGHMANQQAKVAAAAIIATLSGRPVSPAPVVNNTCYSFITNREAVHIASVHQYDSAQKTFISAPAALGLSSEMSVREGEYGFAWAKSIWADALQ